MHVNNQIKQFMFEHFPITGDSPPVFPYHVESAEDAKTTVSDSIPARGEKFERNILLPITGSLTSNQILLSRTLSIKEKRDVVTVINKLPCCKELYSYLG